MMERKTMSQSGESAKSASVRGSKAPAQNSEAEASPIADRPKSSSTRPKVIRAPEFAKRLNAAADNNPIIPPYLYGRHKWLKAAIEVKFNVKITTASMGKWMNGEVKPREDVVRMMAEILKVDEAWLSLGRSPELSPRDEKNRNATASGAVNLLCGLISMNGGHPAFPTEDDARAKAALIDLYAIIRGAQYAFHVNLAADAGHGDYRFFVPTAFEDAFQIGVIQTGDLDFILVELSTDLINERGTRRGGNVDVILAAGLIESVRIRSFRNRL
jgi:hypothetical protein